MTKPWEEEWSAAEQPSPLCQILRRTGPGEACGDLLDGERLVLAVAAPDMARVLLDIEWSGGDDGGYCPACQGVEHHVSSPGHRPACTLDAALRKAGIR